MPGFNYATPGGYTYHKIDPSVYKFTKHPAFNRPPTPPVFKPPENPFAEWTKADEGPEDGQVKAADTVEADGEEQKEAEIQNAEPPDSEAAAQEEVGMYYLHG